MPAKLLLYVVACCICCMSASCKKDEAPSATIPRAELPIETIPPVLVPVTADVSAAIGGYYKALPSKYTASDKSYPLLVFIHGGGGFGNGQLDLPMLLNEGIPQLLDEKKFPAEFFVQGEHFSFIHLAPQFKRQPSAAEVRSFIDYAKAQFRVDANRIYLAGMSNGGKITCDVAAAYPGLFAAIVPMAGVSDTGNIIEKCANLAGAKLPIWIFHNDRDEVTSIDFPTKFVSLLDSFHPNVAPRFTIFPSMGLLGHDAWTRAVDPDFREDQMDIYEWMLQYKLVEL